MNSVELDDLNAITGLILGFHWSELSAIKQLITGRLVLGPHMGDLVGDSSLFDLVVMGTRTVDH